MTAHRLWFAVVLVLCGGCQGLGDYLRHRGLDLADCVKLNVGAGLGLIIDARATDLLAPGLGLVSYTGNVGWEDRETHGTWEECVVVNTPRAVWESAGGTEEERATADISSGQRVARVVLASMFLANERWIRREDSRDVTVEFYSLFNFSDVPSFLRVADPGRYFLRKRETAVLREKDFWQSGWFEVGVTAVFLNARAGVNPLQMIDFVFGIFGLDPAGDDRVLLSPERG